VIETQQIASAGRMGTYAHAFAGLLARDTRVLRREFIPFLLRTVMNPILFTFVFAYVFPKIGEGFHSGGSVNFATILVPGLIAVAMIFQGIAAVALPLVNELGRTKEMEDRIMAPLPIAGVALEKILFGALQSILAFAAIMLDAAVSFRNQDKHPSVARGRLRRRACRCGELEGRVKPCRSHTSRESTA
jgi:ABC-2 type transport system permease protein